jgi:hypothetical protein
MKYPLPLLRRCFAEVRLVLVDSHRNMLHCSVVNTATAIYAGRPND